MALTNWQLFFLDLQNSVTDQPIQDNEVLSVIRNVLDSLTSLDTGGSLYAQEILADLPIAYWRLGDSEGYAQAVLSDSPLAYWRLGETSGTAAGDAGAGAHAGVYTGGYILGQPGVLADGNKSVRFDGTGYVAFGDILNPPAASSLSVEAWFTTSATPAVGTQTIVCRWYPGWILGILNSGAVFLDISQPSSSNSLSAGSGFNDGKPHHVVATFDGLTNTYTIYVDKVLIATSVIATPFEGVDGGANMYIGSLDPTTQPFIGTVDEVAVYRYPLLPGQVANHYALRTSTIATVSSATVADATGNGNTGTIVGGVTLRQPGALSDGDTAAAFDGVTSGILAGGALNLTSGPLSVEAWVQKTVGSSDAGIAGIGIANGYQLNWHLGTVMYFYIGGGANAANVAFTSAGEHHVVGTWDGTTNPNGIKLYIDGALVATATAATTTLSATGFRIGQSSTMFNGLIDEVAVYRYALSPTQIATHYALQSALINFARVSTPESRVGFARVGYSQVG